jgi:heme/copper-type cytochrome/quinol oxidase subunit 1
MPCSSDMIFPRLNALSLWLVFNSLIIMFLSMFIDGGINAGWTSHAPSSIINYSSIDLMFFSLHIVGLSSLLGSINSIITLLKSSNLSIINSFNCKIFLSFHYLFLYYCLLLFLILYNLYYCWY